MFNRHDEHNQHNYQSVSVHVPSQSQAAPLVSLAMFGMVVVLLAGFAVIIYRLIVDTVEILTGVLVALLATVTTLAPWLIGGAVLVALVIVALRLLPQAMAEAAELRQHYIASRQPLMLEMKDVDYPVVDLRTVRTVTTIEHEQ